MPGRWFDPIETVHCETKIQAKQGRRYVDRAYARRNSRPYPTPADWPAFAAAIAPPLFEPARRYTFAVPRGHWAPGCIADRSALDLLRSARRRCFRRQTR